VVVVVVVAALGLLAAALWAHILGSRLAAVAVAVAVVDRGSLAVALVPQLLVVLVVLLMAPPPVQIS
jgi:hypothetical protein